MVKMALIIKAFIKAFPRVPYFRGFGNYYGMYVLHFDKWPSSLHSTDAVKIKKKEREKILTWLSLDAEKNKQWGPL